MILARTIKGKGVSFAEDKDGWHGRAFKKGEELDSALAELEKQFVPVPDRPGVEPRRADSEAGVEAARRRQSQSRWRRPAYTLGDQVATREAYGTALAKLGEADPRIVALDADVKNSTFSDRFEKVAPERFYQNFIAEQVMVGAAMGLAARGAIPFPSTFACFLTRAADFVRMAAISNVGIKLAGSHAGVSIGEDGPSQMALEDLAMYRAEPNYTVLYPSRRGQHRAADGADGVSPGPGLHAHQPSEDAGDLRQRRHVHDRRAEGAARERRGRRDGDRRRHHVVRSAEGLRSAEGGRHGDPRHRSLLGPADRQAPGSSPRRSATGGQLITVEDHYAAGGIGDAVAEAVADAGYTVHRLAVREIPRSGKPEELVERFGISAKHIVEAVTSFKK